MIHVWLLHRESIRGRAPVLLVATYGLAAPAETLSAQAVPGSEAGSVEILGPPPPVAPAVITRDETGNATIRAFPVDEPIDIDGEFSEDVYGRIPSITGFVQSLPDEGAAPTEQTEVWILFDDENIYVSARNWDSAPEREWVANEMRRDTNQLRQNQTFGVMFDTFYDRRNGVMFYTNPLGALAEFQMTNEGNPNSDWNPIWDVRTGRFDGGWTVEMEIPFQSLRYRPGREQIWGVQLRRAIRRKNEWNFLTFVPRFVAGSGAAGSFRVSMAGTLVGIEVPPVGRDLEVKPYVISGLESDFSVDPRISNDGYADAGLDVKYGITENLTADFTFNTDFAQVEVDEQQVNLTRFNLFFPEKREFFLEGRGIFDFAPSISGGAGGGGGGGGWPGPGGGGRSYSLLQPADRARGGPAGPDPRGRPRDGEDRILRCGCAQHPDRRPRHGHRVYELQCTQAPSRCPGPEQHRRTPAEPVGVGGGGRVEPGLRGRRLLCLLREPEPPCLVREDADRGFRRERRELPGGLRLQRGHVGRRGGPPPRRRRLQPRGGVRPPRGIPAIPRHCPLQPPARVDRLDPSDHPPGGAGISRE